MVRCIYIPLGLAFALLSQALAMAGKDEFRQIVLLYRDGRIETFAYGLAPFVLVSDASVTVVYLKDKQVVPRQSLKAVCQDACPVPMPAAIQDTIVWDARKPLVTQGKILSDPGFALVQDGKEPVKNARFDRVRYIRFAE